MTESEFAKAVGATRSAVQHWERVGGATPNLAHRTRIARVIQISVASLLAGTLSAGDIARRARDLPLLLRVQSGNYTVIDNFAPGSALEMVRTTVPVNRHTYALRVRGDSMVSAVGDSFPEGSMLIVEPDMQAEEGDYVIALNTESETMFKQLVLVDGAYFLSPLNKRYPTKALGTGKIIGVVRESTRSLR